MSRGEDDYLSGNIVEIDMHNFMTYDHIKSRPGSRLNLVIGPNGTGKRSLVCAIAIGLAREPQVDIPPFCIYHVLGFAIKNSSEPWRMNMVSV
jgi:hypothetical protein